MCTQISRWGNSLAVRIPKAVAMELNLDEESEVELSVQDGRIVLSPVPARFSLEQLLAGVSDENLHEEQEWGGAVGAEAW